MEIRFTSKSKNIIICFEQSNINLEYDIEFQKGKQYTTVQQKANTNRKLQ
jgi:hypothetical protein